MKTRQRIARKIIQKSFRISVSTIEFFSDMSPYKEQVNELRKLPNGTLGKVMADCLDKHNLNLVPKFESHDLKHVLLGFDMTPEDEIRLQAFMIGNGNYSIPSFAIFLFGALLLPDLWNTLYSDYRQGRTTVPISNWSLEEYAEVDLKKLKASLTNTVVDRPFLFNLKQITKLGAFASIAAGVLGMLFCLPFLFSSNLADLVGAGFPFVGGSILAIGGLLALSNLSRQHT